MVATPPGRVGSHRAAGVTRATCIALAIPQIALVLSLAGPAHAQGAPAGDPGSARVRRLAKLGEVWGEIRYRHPWLAYKDIDWDAALIKALLKTEAARDSSAYAAAVGEMLGALGDPITYVVGQEPSGTVVPPNSRPFLSEERSVLILNLAETAKPDSALEAQMSEITARVAKAETVVVDLRGSAGTWASSQSLNQAIRKLAPLLFAGELRLPGNRFTSYDGYPSQDPADPAGGGYSFGFESRALPVLTGPPGPKPGRAIFLLDAMAPLSPILLALRERGIASFVAEGGMDTSWVEPAQWLDAGEGVTVQSRLAEAGADLTADREFPARAGSGAVDAAFAEAMELALKRPRAIQAPGRAASLPPPAWRPDPRYPEHAYPDRAHRQLAAIRFWNVIRFFYPHLRLMDGAWEGALERFLPRFEGARNAREYARAVMEMSVLIQDNHTLVLGEEATKLVGGRNPVPIDVLEIEGKPVVVDVPPVAAAAGVEPGDVIVAVDGKPIEERIRALEPLMTASTQHARRFVLIRQALMGTDSTVTLLLRGAKGSRKVTLVRTLEAYLKAQSAGGPSFRILPSNVGFVSMERLRPWEVTEMFEKLGDTRAIIFDLRGYPTMAAWPIAPYLNTRGATIGAVFETPGLGPEGPRRRKYEQPLPEGDVPRYRGRTITLIDERAVSRAEHSCLFFEAANGTTFVGSPTSGTDGGVTRVSLPGGLLVMFTGGDVRHADGRQLQRVGIQPDVPVRPTIAGLRAGRDEVLDRALEILGEENFPRR